MVNYLRKVSAVQIWILIVLNLFIASFSSVSCADAAIPAGTMVEYNGNPNEPANEEEKTGEVAIVQGRKDGYFEVIGQDLLIYIASYLIDPVASLGLTNKRFYTFFHDKFPLGYYFKQHFEIPEFVIVDPNEKELHAIFSFFGFRKNPSMQFNVLLSDFVSKSRRFDALVRPFSLYLKNFYERSGYDRRLEISHYSNTNHGQSFMNLLGRTCAEYGYLDLAFEFLEGDKSNFMNFVTFNRNKNVLFKFLKSNLARAEQHARLIIADFSVDSFKYNRRIVSWATDCIIHNMPQDLYLNMLNSLPFLLKDVAESLFHSVRVSESEHSRIYCQLESIIHDLNVLVAEKEISFISLINDIRFGPETNIKLDFSSFDKDLLVTIIDAALLANKRDLFNEAYNFHYQRERISKSDRSHEKILSSVLAPLGHLDHEILQSERFKVVYELIAANANDLFSAKDFYGGKIRNVLFEAYAPVHLEKEGEKYTIEFVALENLLAMGFPSNIRIELKDQNAADSFLMSAFFSMKVFDEDTFTTFLRDYQNYYMPTKRHNRETVSLELMKLVLSSPALREQVASSGMTLGFHLEVEDIQNDKVDLSELENANQIIEVVNLVLIAPKLKKAEHFRQVEILARSSVAQCFLDYEGNKLNHNNQLTDFDYYQWRSALAYWINSDQQERIKEIRSSSIIWMLRLEFPDKMNQICGPYPSFW